jgi:hypothetical protein
MHINGIAKKRHYSHGNEQRADDDETKTHPENLYRKCFRDALSLNFSWAPISD